MKKIMLTIVYIFLQTSQAFAGLGVCHDGNGNVTKIESDSANPTYFKTTTNCVYFEVWKDGITDNDYVQLRTLLKDTPRKYIKWGLSGKPEEMDSIEKAAADLAEQQAANDARKAEIDKLNVTVEDVIVALVKRINARLPQAQAITKQEIITQIKQDAGL